MPVLPDLRRLFTAADAVEHIADTLETDAAAVDRLVEDLPWRGPRREVVAATTRLAVGSARGQVEAERYLARNLRQLALEVERELELLAGLADRARRHLEELLRRAEALAQIAADAAADFAVRAASVVAELVTMDLADAVREARELAERAYEKLRSIAARLQTLPVSHDPVWRQLGPELLAWRPL